MFFPHPTFCTNRSSSCISTCTLNNCETLGLGYGKSIAVAFSHWVLMHPNAPWFVVDDVVPCFFLFLFTLSFLTTVLLTYFSTGFDLVVGGV